MLDYFTGFKNISGDFTVHEYGEERCRKGYAFGPYIRQTYFLHYIYEGKGTFEAEGKVYNIRKGQMFLICPGQVTVYKADEEEPWFYRWISFGGGGAGILLNSAGLCEDDPIFTDDSSMKVGSVLKEIVDGGHMSFCKTMSLFWKLADAMVNNMKQVSFAGGYVERTKSHIHSYYMENINIGGIAAQIGIDRSYLSRLFKEREGVSPQKYMILYRVRLAKSLLQTTDMPVSDIARMVGYSDAMDFSKIFKRYTGVSPVNWRKSPKD